MVGSCVPVFGSSFFQPMTVSQAFLRSNLTRFAGLLASRPRGKTLRLGLLTVSSESLVVLFGSPQPHFQAPDLIAIASITAAGLPGSPFNHLDKTVSHVQGRESPTRLAYRAEKVAEGGGEALFTAGVIPYIQRLHFWT